MLPKTRSFLLQKEAWGKLRDEISAIRLHHSPLLGQELMYQSNLPEGWQNLGLYET